MQLLQKIREIENRPYQIPHFLKDKHIPSLDGWRAIAIFFVLISHIKFNIESTYPKAFNSLEFLPVGHLGVQIFFIISGFLITSLLIKEKLKNGNVNLKAFFIRRTLRIVPLLWLYIFVVAILNYHIDLKLNLVHFLAALFYVSNFDITKASWLLGHTWSLSVEEQFYLIWPFVFKKTKNLILWILFFLAIAIIFKPIAYTKHELNNYLLAPFITEAASIFTGALMAILAFKGFLDKIQFKPIFLLLAASTTYGTILLMQNGLLGKFTLTLGNPLINVSIAYLLLYTIQQKGTAFYKLLNNKHLIKIGIMSYSIYIWQQLFLLPINVNPSWHETFFFPLNLLVTFGIAYLSYNYFEKPFLKLKTKFSA